MATTAEILAAISGRYGPINLRWRYEVRDDENQFIYDITELVGSCSIDFDADREVTRSAAFQLLPGYTELDDFEPGSRGSNIAAFMDLTVRDGEVVTYQWGLFATPLPKEEVTFRRVSTDPFSPATYTLKGDFVCPDLAGVLARETLNTPYAVEAGDNLVNHMRALLDAVGLQHSITDAGYTAVSPQSFPVGTSYLKALNAIADAGGYFHVYADPTGVIKSQVREILYANALIIAYGVEDTANVAPMLVGQWTIERDLTAYNSYRLYNDSPQLGSPTGATATLDYGAPTSVVEVGERIVEATSDVIAGTSAAGATVAWELFRAMGSTKLVSGTILVDPRHLSPLVAAYNAVGIFAGVTELDDSYLVTGWKHRPGEPTMSITFEVIYAQAGVNYTVIA